jgi:hypothetical protein
MNAIVNESLALLMATLKKGTTEGVELAKAWTQSPNQLQGLTAFDLEAPAKTLLPTHTPLRNMLARVGPGRGIQANWRAITKVNVNRLSGGVTEGDRGGVIATEVKEYYANYRTLGFEDYVTYEAELAGGGFDDVKARAVQGLLRTLMLFEELVILGGLGTHALGQTPTPSLAAVASGGNLPQSTAVHVRCVALSLEGYWASNLVEGVKGRLTRTNADGSISAYGGGAAQPSAAASVTTAASGGSVHSVTASVTPVPGAAAYAWYVGDATNRLLSQITTHNSVVITSLPSGTQNVNALQVGGADTDNSTNNLVFDGFLGIAAKSGSGSYWKDQPTGAPGVGTPLTSDGAGGIVEFDEAFQHWWDEYRMSPNEIWVSSRELRTLAKRVLAGSAGTPSNVRFTYNTAQGEIRGGSAIRGYLNPYAMGQMEVPIKLHPNLPPGMIVFLTHELPYQMSGITNVNQIRLRRDYYQLEWPQRSRKYEYGVYSDQLLQCYFTPGIGVLYNIGAG